MHGPRCVSCDFVLAVWMLMVAAQRKRTAFAVLFFARSAQPAIAYYAAGLCAAMQPDSDPRHTPDL